MLKVNKLRDEKTGRFQMTTDTTRYKTVQFNNKRMSEHARAFCLALNIPFIPKGFIIHHIDENKRNNNIDNLCLMTVTAHNRKHSHPAWNRGITADNNVEWKNTVYKQRIAREKTYLKKFEEAYKLRASGMTFIDIAKKLNITRVAASARFLRYKELSKKYEQPITR